MKRIIAMITIAAVMLTASCSKFDPTELWNSIHKLEDRVAALEELCKQLNTNIDALKGVVNALEKNDYITNVSPVRKDGEVIGYTISFTHSDAITIFHGENGKDGKDGKDGQDGYTPQIGVRKDVDGCYYWTIDGEWMMDESGNKIKAVGEDGEDGKDGENGADGKDGANGKDATVPRLKIEDGCWYVTYDDGQTWVSLGDSSSEEDESDALFSDVDTSNELYIIFTLADGTTFKVPTWKAIEQLYALCEQMNTNISSVQAIVTALQENDTIKSIEPLIENGEETGWKITFAKGGTITIYHGKDGADGKDGKDGYAPEIGVKKDTDGVYYWTINGEWILDEDGQKMRVCGIDGQNGQDGKDGKDGKDGVTPELKIDNGYWYISYDGGKTWTKLGKATGNNGTNGSDGIDGRDGIIVEVYETSTYVTFVLSDGTSVTIMKSVGTGEDGEYITFKDKVVETICLEYCDLDSDGRISYAEAVEVYDFNYIFAENTEITSFDELQYFTSLQRVEFSDCTNLTSVVVPESVKYLNFWNCTNLTKVAIPKYAEQAEFYSCVNLRSITLPGTLTDFNFSQCTKLETVAISEGISKIGYGAFYNCENLKRVNIPDSVQEIGENAFSMCGNLTSIEIPSNVRTIGNYAFDGAGIQNITLPEGLQEIGERAFSQCWNLSEITIPYSVVSLAKSAFQDNYLQKFYGKFASSDNLSLVMDDEFIAFASGSGVSEYEIPYGVKVIASVAFSQDRGLKRVTIPESVHTIKTDAFSVCYALEEITIPQSVTVIEPRAFYTCSKLSGIYGKFSSSDNKCLIVDGYLIVTALYGLTEYTIPSEVTVIGKSACKSWSRLEKVILHDKITAIEDNAFFYNERLASIEIPESVQSIGTYAFWGCYKLENVYSRATTPPVAGKDYWGKWYAFSNTSSTLKIHVPQESVNSYKNAGGWSEYSSQIYGYDF